MDISDKLQEIEHLQKELSGRFNKLIAETDKDTMAADLKQLKLENESFKETLKETRRKFENSQKENSTLRQQLYAQLLAEKAGFLSRTDSLLKSYFGQAESSSHSRLKVLELEIRGELKALEERSSKLTQKRQKGYRKSLGEIRATLEKDIEQQKVEEEKLRSNLLRKAGAAMSEAGATPLNEESIRERLKLNRLEHNIGLKLFGGLGALLITIGLGFLFYQLSRYGIFSALAMAVTSVIFLGLGSFAIHRKLGMLGRVLLGTGSAILYTTIIYAFMKGLLPGLWWAGALSVIATVLVGAMALVHRSQVVLSFSLIGGAIPLYFYMVYRQFLDSPKGLTDFDYQLVSAYLIMLQAGILGISLFKRWRWTKILSYLPFLPALLIATLNHSSAGVGLTLVSVSLLLFQAAILITPAIRNALLHRSEHAALAVNTLLSSTLIFVFVEKMGKGQFLGLTALVMVCAYLILAALFGWKRREDRMTLYILLSSALIFAVCAIPMQFGAEWNMIGWSIMGLLLLAGGRRLSSRFFEAFGGGIFILALGWYILFDVIDAQLFYSFHDSSLLFLAKNTLMILSTVGVLALYLVEQHHKRLKLSPSTGFLVELGKVLVWIHFMLFSAWLSWYLFNESLLAPVLTSAHRMQEWFTIATNSLVAGLTGWLFLRIPQLREKAGRYLRVISSAFSSLYLLLLMFEVDVLSVGFSSSLFVRSLFAVMTVALSLYALLNTYLILRELYREGHLSSQILWLLMGAKSLLWVTLFNASQVDHQLPVVFSVTYAVLALACISVGFLRASFPLRVGGMGLLLIAIAIAFVRIAWDGTALTKSFTFIGLGLFSFTVLLIYSFVDRRLQAKFEAHGVEEVNNAQ